LENETVTLGKRKMTKKRKVILIVEDEADGRDLLNDLLKDKYSLLFAKTGQEAVDTFREKHETIDLILLDIHLPDFDAFEVFKRFEEICFTGIPNIIMVTAYSKSSDIIKSMTENRAFDHIAKPFENKELLAAIEKGLTQTFQRKEYVMSQDIALKQIYTDRNFFMINKLQELRQIQDEKLTLEDIEPFIYIHQKVENKQELLTLLEEDTGEKASPAWTPKVLIVEDEPDFRDMMEEILTRNKYQALMAADADTALALIKEHHDIDVILLDLGLPGIQGTEIIKVIKKEVKDCWSISANEDPDIIVITSYHDKTTIVDVLKAGAHKFLTKPIAPREVLTEIQNIFLNRYYLKELTDLLTMLKTQRAPFRYRFQILNNFLKAKPSDTMNLFDIYGFFGEYKNSSFPEEMVLPKKIDLELKEFLFELNAQSKKETAPTTLGDHEDDESPNKTIWSSKKPFKILILEDEQDYLEILVDLFKKHDFDVSYASNSNDALKILHDDPTFHCILLDYTLHENLNGIDLAKMIRQRHASIYLFLHTAHDNLTMPHIEETFMQIGLSRFVTKGSIKELYATVYDTLIDHLKRLEEGKS